MSEFQPIYPEATNLDPNKRVKYSHGLVLGVDEFNQEELYLLEKQRLHNRALHGYGTLCGLKVSVFEDEHEAGRWKLLVAPGIALDALGREIRVPEAQCADLSLWLIKHRDEVLEHFGIAAEASPPVTLSPPEILRLCLVLCYQQCDTDYVPVPSGPCQSLDKTSVASRTADDFKLSLEFDCPQQIEEEKLQQLISLLKQIEISEAPGGLALEDMGPLVRSILNEDSPPVFSPPIGDMHMRPSEAELFINTALRIWVTEVRSALLPSERNCAAGPIDEECLLLAQIDLMIEDTAVGLRIVGDVSKDEQQRPFLLQTRLLQEQILQCCSGVSAAITGSPGSAFIDETNLMHLTGDESVEGHKTFTDPLAFASDGRFRKRIMLSPMTGMPISTTTASPEFFRAGVPALRIAQGGEVSFNITVPDDIEYAIPPRVRLVWGIRGVPDTTISFNWRIRNRFADPGNMFGPFSSTTVAGTETDATAGRVYVTEFVNLDDGVSDTDVFGAIRILLDTVSPSTMEIYLLHVELNYDANRLGRPVS